MSLKNLSEKYKKLANEFKETAAKQLGEDLKILFDKYPTVENVGFKCYALYFNDGDSCPFRARNDAEQLYINDIQGYSDDEGKLDDSVYEEFADLFQCIPDDIYEKMFGNDTEVTFYRDGTTKVDDYCSHN